MNLYIAKSINLIPFIFLCLHLVFVAMAPTRSICTTAETGRNGAFGQSQNSLRVSKATRYQQL